MEKTANSGHRHSLFAAAAAIAPVTHGASALPWTLVLAMGAAALFLGRWSAPAKGWVATLQSLWACVVIKVLMDWSAAYWEPMPFRSIVPVILLALALWTVAVPGKASQIACVLLCPLLILLGVVLLSGVSEMEIRNLKPEWKLPDVSLLAMLLLPWANGGKKNRKYLGGILLGGIAVSVITAGVLSSGVSAAADSGIYELSRSLSLLGIAERFESIVASAMTIGLYLSMTYLMEPSGGKWLWLYAGAAALYFLKIPVGGWFLGIGSLLIWVVFPNVFSGEIFSKIGKKSLDK